MTSYLFNTRVIKQSEGVQTVLGTVRKHTANPLFGEDRPWEVRFDNLYANVLYDDDGLFKCWYSPFTMDQATAETPPAQRQAGGYVARLQEVRKRYGAAAREMGVCYATATDGITWTKPALTDRCQFGGSRANNVVMRYAHGSGVFKDPHAADPAERYKMVLYHEETRRMMVAWSPDGLHWSPPFRPEISFSRRDHPANPIAWMGDTHNNTLWAPSLGRCADHPHVASGTTATAGWARRERRLRQWSASQPIWSDAEDQIYAIPIFAYGNLYLGLPMIFNATTDTVDCELAWSPDTIHWQRLCAGTPFNPRGPAGRYDSGCIYAAATPVLLGDEIRLYYGGNNYLHTDWRDGYFCLATLPRSLCRADDDDPRQPV